jgi:hypothetical protein
MSNRSHAGEYSKHGLLERRGALAALFFISGWRAEARFLSHDF